MVKSRRERFEDVAGKRVQYILDKLELLGNCSNKGNYEYTEDDVKKMTATIREQFKKTESRFYDELGRSTKRTFKF